MAWRMEHTMMLNSQQSNQYTNVRVSFEGVPSQRFGCRSADLQIGIEI